MLRNRAQRYKCYFERDSHYRAVELVGDSVGVGVGGARVEWRAKLSGDEPVAISFSTVLLGSVSGFFPFRLFYFYLSRARWSRRHTTDCADPARELPESPLRVAARAPVVCGRRTGTVVSLFAGAAETVPPPSAATSLRRAVHAGIPPRVGRALHAATVCTRWRNVPARVYVVAAQPLTVYPVTPGCAAIRVHATAAGVRGDGADGAVGHQEQPLVLLLAAKRAR